MPSETSILKAIGVWSNCPMLFTDPEFLGLLFWILVKEDISRTKPYIRMIARALDVLMDCARKFDYQKQWLKY
jgi:hypothetical protein